MTGTREPRRCPEQTRSLENEPQRATPNPGKGASSEAVTGFATQMISAVN